MDILLGIVAALVILSGILGRLEERERRAHR